LPSAAAGSARLFLTGDNCVLQTRFVSDSRQGRHTKQAAEPRAVTMRGTVGINFVVDCDGDVIGVLECPGATIERGIVEVPLWRRELPNQLAKIAHVLAEPSRSRSVAK
jgi:hypothetical protein